MSNKNTFISIILFILTLFLGFILNQLTLEGPLKVLEPYLWPVMLVAVTLGIVLLWVDGRNSESADQSPPQLDPPPESAPHDLLGTLHLRSKDALQHTLTHPDGEFSQKYVADSIYTERKEAERKFNEFLGQSDKRCYIVTGRAGRGKTNLLCKLAERAEQASDRIAVLFNSARLTLTETALEREVIDTLQAPFTSLNDFGRFLTAHNTQLIIFIDAINELHTTKGNIYAEFSDQLTTLLTTIDENNYPILFCISCRTEFWRKFKAQKWAHDHTFAPTGLERPTYELDQFSDSEVEQAIQDYFYWFAIRGELTGSARHSCRDPIMLRYLCAAYTKRVPFNDKTLQPSQIESYQIGRRDQLSRKEILDLFVKNRSREIARRARNVLDIDRQPTVYKRTTLYLIEMANVMLRNARPYITADEAFGIAEKLKHPDVDIGRDRFLEDEKAIFFRFVDEGIILDKRSDDTYEFVFELYLEYTLGRYIALERWPALHPQRKTDEEAIINDFNQLLQKHTQLAETEEFTNLFGALQFAILLTEENDYGVYRENPYLYIRLLEQMSQGTAFGFDWIQLACATITETTLARQEVWLNVESKQRERQEDRFRQLLGVLSRMTKSADFVVLWDVEKTLYQLAQANFDLVISQVESWAQYGTGLQPMFATRTLARLGQFDSQRIITILNNLFQKYPAFKTDFWLARELIFTIRKIAEQKRNGQITVSPSAWNTVQKILLDYATQSPNRYIRGAALPVLPFVGWSYDVITHCLEQENWAGALWNFAFTLSQWARDWGLEQGVWDNLHLLVQRNPHIHYAVERAALALRDRNPKQANALLATLPDGRWRVDMRHGWSEPDKSRHFGIVYAPLYLEPDYDNHIECRERIQAISDKLLTTASRKINWINPRLAQLNELRRVHHEGSDRHRDRSAWPEYIDAIREADELRDEQSSNNLAVGPSELRYESYKIARMSAGGVLAAIDYVEKGDAPAAWVLGRPPGHLANNTICIFNNIAVGARYAQQHTLPSHNKRVLIVDCDAHHGSHTARVFVDDPSVIYFSMHIEGDYARESGTLAHTGEGAGEGYTFNIPYPPNMGDAGYNLIIDQLLAPLAYEFEPSLILLSAGFDGHFDDPLTPNCFLTENAYMHLALQLQQIASELKIKIVAATEGGYGLEAMANSAVQMMNIIGEWSIPPDTIGFIPKPKDYKANIDPTCLQQVQTLIRERVEMMAVQKAKDITYAFDCNKPHWQSLLSAHTDI